MLQVSRTMRALSNLYRVALPAYARIQTRICRDCWLYHDFEIVLIDNDRYHCALITLVNFNAKQATRESEHTKRVPWNWQRSLLRLFYCRGKGNRKIASLALTSLRSPDSRALVGLIELSDRSRSGQDTPVFSLPNANEKGKIKLAGYSTLRHSLISIVLLFEVLPVKVI